MRIRLLGTVTALTIIAACGGSSPSTPSSGGGAGGGTGASGATITITAAGVSAANVTVAVGQTVTVVNNDTRSHEIASNPHPQHGSCPSIESGLGTIAAGQTKVTRAFTTAASCGYHDHGEPSNNALKGTITVQ